MALIKAGLMLFFVVVSCCANQTELLQQKAIVKPERCEKWLL
ncbi:hypothetical protein [Heyndrickxia oleronia]|nr:hypothetical protein [Heyndrickxia oleronia]